MKIWKINFQCALCMAIPLVAVALMLTQQWEVSIGFATVILSMWYAEWSWDRSKKRFLDELD